MDKSHLSLLKKISKCKSDSYVIPIYDHAGKSTSENDAACYLAARGFISYNESFTQDHSGEVFLASITESGKDALAAEECFNWRYILTNILVPILVGVSASVITTLLTRLLP